MRIRTVVAAGVLAVSSLASSSCSQGGGRDAVADPAPGARTVDGCPARYEGDGRSPWVPATPAAETQGRLVPDADPVEVVVCRYSALAEEGLGGEVPRRPPSPSPDRSGALEGEVRLAGGLERVRTDLLLPAQVDGGGRACTTMGGALVPYLVHLQYPDGDVWVSTVEEPNGCSPTGNGTFVSPAYAADLWKQAYASRRWPAAVVDECGPQLGRAGQEQALVPGGWVSLLVCGEDGSRREVGRARAEQAAALVGQLETGPATGGCTGTPTSVERLVFGYAEGPPVGVRFLPGCAPALDNGSLNAAPTPEQAAALTALLA